jgi:hypothetical protein
LDLLGEHPSVQFSSPQNLYGSPFYQWRSLCREFGAATPAVLQQCYEAKLFKAEIGSVRYENDYAPCAVVRSRRGVRLVDWTTMETVAEVALDFMPVRAWWTEEGLRLVITDDTTKCVEFVAREERAI